MISTKSKVDNICYGLLAAENDDLQLKYKAEKPKGV